MLPAWTNSSIFFARRHSSAKSARSQSSVLFVSSHSPVSSARSHSSVFARRHSSAKSARSPSIVLSARSYSPVLSARIHSPVLTARKHSSAKSARSHSPMSSAWSHSPVLSARSHLSCSLQLLYILYVVICKESTAMCKCNLQASMQSQGVTPPCNTQDKKSLFHGVSLSVIHSYLAEKTEPKLLLFIRVLQSHEQDLGCVSAQRGITFLFIVPGVTSVNKKSGPRADSSERFTHKNRDLRRYWEARAIVLFKEKILLLTVFPSSKRQKRPCILR